MKKLVIKKNDPSLKDNQYASVLVEIYLDDILLCRLWFEDISETEESFEPYYDSGVYDCGRIFKSEFDQILIEVNKYGF